MGYSKETERQNQALNDILSGNETEKRVMVGYKSKEKENLKTNSFEIIIFQIGPKLYRFPLKA